MKNLISILLLIISNTIFCQTVRFNNIYSPFTYQEADNIFEYSDGYIMLGGGIDINDPGQKIKIIIYNLDNIGNENWIKTYGDSIYNYYFGERNSLIKNYDGSFSLSGGRTGNGNITGMLTKFNQDFDTLWTKLYFDNPDFTAFYNHIQTDDGGYVLVGCSTESDPDGDVLLVKTDSYGNMLWYKKYGTSARDMGLCIVGTDDGGYLIGGAANGNNYYIKTDSEGNLQWSNQYGHNALIDGGIVQIVRTQDLGYVLVARETLFSEGTSTILYYGKGAIKKLDADFNEKWYKLYGETGYQTTFGSCVETFDGRLVLTLMENLPNRSKILFLTSEGDSIRKVDYVADGSTAEQWLLTIKQTQDNGFIMAGVAYDPQVMWLVKTDSCGCVTDDCGCGENTVQEFGINAGIQVFPNPSIQDFTVNLDLTDYNNTELKITDLNGHLKSVIPVTGKTTEIETKGWSAGIYICSLFTDGKLVKVEKLVLE